MLSISTTNRLDLEEGQEALSKMMENIYLLFEKVETEFEPGAKGGIKY